MKFAEHLQTHVTSEWVKQYINYREMKSMLYAAIEQSPSAELVDPEVLTRYFAKFDEQFFHFCDSELAKINTFYSEKLAEATRKYANLRSELSEAQDEDITKENKGRYRKNLLRKKNNSVRKIQELKLAFSEFYLSLILLQNYQNLNFTGFRKILKKHDKLLNVDFGAKWRIEHVEASHFYTNKDIDRLIQETENVVTQIEGGDRQRAMKRLRVPPLNEQQSPWTTFKVGLFSGSFIVLSVAVIISALFNKGRESWRPAFRLYRAPFLIIEFLFLWGINVYGWRSSGVNHVLIFELDPRNHLSDQHIMEMAAIFGVVWCVSVLCFLYSAALSIPAYVSPMALYILMVMFLMNPIKIFRFEARFWTMRILARVLCAPLFHVEFADFWVADQLNSIVPVFLDLQYFFCFFSTNANLNEAGDLRYCIRNPGMIAVRTVVAVLPAWFRCSQCLRRYHDTKDNVHVYNACKYFSSFFVVIFSSITFATTGQYEKNTDNPFFYLWICALVISSCYAYLWDIKMDWGLFDAKAGDNRFLREEIVYSSTWFYYIAIVGDFILRFGWTLSMSLIEMGYLDSDIMLSILAPLEVLRRFVWNFFRLENEHLNNCGKFRAVRDISVAPMDSSDQATILRMMDEEDGVTNRRLKKNGKKKGEQRLLLDGMGDSQDDLNL